MSQCVAHINGETFSAKFDKLKKKTGEKMSLLAKTPDPCINEESKSQSLIEK